MTMGGKAEINDEANTPSRLTFLEAAALRKDHRRLLQLRMIRLAGRWIGLPVLGIMLFAVGAFAFQLRVGVSVGILIAITGSLVAIWQSLRHIDDQIFEIRKRIGGAGTDPVKAGRRVRISRGPAA
jgi:hypothetical protein